MSIKSKNYFIKHHGGLIEPSANRMSGFDYVQVDGEYGYCIRILPTDRYNEQLNFEYTFWFLYQKAWYGVHVEVKHAFFRYIKRLFDVLHDQIETEFRNGRILTLAQFSQAFSRIIDIETANAFEPHDANKQNFPFDRRKKIISMHRLRNTDGRILSYLEAGHKEIFVIKRQGKLSQLALPYRIGAVVGLVALLVLIGIFGISDRNARGEQGDRWGTINKNRFSTQKQSPLLMPKISPNINAPKMQDLQQILEDIQKGKSAPIEIESVLVASDKNVGTKNVNELIKHYILVSTYKRFNMVTYAEMKKLGETRGLSVDVLEQHRKDSEKLKKADNIKGLQFESPFYKHQTAQ